MSIEASSRPSTRATIILIVAFWSFYFAVNTFRAWLFDSHGQLQMLANRLVVTIVGAGLTAILWLFLRTIEKARPGWQVFAVFAASLPIALTYASANHLVFEVIAPIEGMAEMIEMKQKGEVEMWKGIIDLGLTWYFFIVAWGMLYIALAYAARVRSAERQLAALRASAQTAELRALRYQVNPHFLFNTLNSLSSLVMVRRHEEAERMILNMSDFFRASLTGDASDDVRLEDEIALQQLYLAIEKERFPDRLSVEVDLPDELIDTKVPGLILQPLVENAIRHGVARTASNVHVRVSARRHAERLVLVVEDDADGDGAGPAGHGVGIRNVCDRLRARFGDAASCSHGPLPKGGYRVELVMPVLRG